MSLGPISFRTPLPREVRQVARGDELPGLPFSPTPLNTLTLDLAGPVGQKPAIVASRQWVAPAWNALRKPNAMQSLCVAL
jgi:hypothetical protein